MKKRFENKVIIVTGGSKGIGKACAVAFAQESGKIVIADQDQIEGEKTIHEIKENQGDAIFVSGDVSQSDDVRKIINTAVKTYGGIDMLFNNAGIQTYGTVVEMPEEAFDRTLAVNLKSQFLTCKYAIPEMLKRGGGSIVNTASVQGIATQLNVAAYAASKGAIIAMTKTIALDYAKENIRCNAIAPASVRTPMLEGSAQFFEPDSPNAAIQKWGESHPIGRVAQPEEIGNMVLFLASDDASFCTGGCYLVDGGVMASLGV